MQSVTRHSPPNSGLKSAFKLASLWAPNFGPDYISDNTPSSSDTNLLDAIRIRIGTNWHRAAQIPIWSEQLGADSDPSSSDTDLLNATPYQFGSDLDPSSWDTDLLGATRC